MATSASTANDAAFTPPFCPNPGCPWHSAADILGWRFQRRGARSVQRATRPTQRFRCGHCRRWFCDATFSLDYWKKKPGLAPRIFPLIVDGKALRQAARTLRVAPSTVKRHERQLARQALLHLEHALHRLRGRLSEPVELDGLRSFAGSQFEPAEVSTLLASSSGFLLACDPFPLRRSGSMSPRQKHERRRREALHGRPDPRARRRSVARLLHLALELTPPTQPLQLRSDDEPDYLRVRRALHRPVVHTRVSSRTRRQTPRHPLWLTNHKHRLLRHLLASLRRETIAHHKTLQGLAERLALVQLWLNCTKGVSERRVLRARTTPAMLLGLADQPVGAAKLFGERLFPARVGLENWLRERYEGQLVRPGERPAPAVPRFAA